MNVTLDTPIEIVCPIFSPENFGRLYQWRKGIEVNRFRYSTVIPRAESLGPTIDHLSEQVFNCPNRRFASLRCELASGNQTAQHLTGVEYVRNVSQIGVRAVRGLDTDQP